MRSIFVLLCARSAVAQATECQVAEETTMLQARQLVQKHMRAADTKGLNAKGLVKSLEHVANNFASMSTDEVNEALAAATEALAMLSPAIQKQVGFLQDTVNHAVAAVEACHGDAGVVQRAGLWEQAEAQAVISATCEAELATAVADEAQICSAVSVADVQSECACNEATARREDKEELCAATLTAYEFAYCEHNLQCNTYQDCHETETAVYNQVRNDVDAEMGPVELEYIAAQQSTCIVGVIQANMLAGGAMDFVAIAACSAVDTSALLLVHPDLPAAPEACPAASTGSPVCAGSSTPPLPRYIGGVASGAPEAIYWEAAGVKYWVGACSMCDDVLPVEHRCTHGNWVNVEPSYIDSLQTGGGFPGTDGVRFQCTQHPQYPSIA